MYERFHPIFGNSLNAVVIHNKNSDIVYANDEAEGILGISFDQMVGKKATDPSWKFVNADGTQMKLDDYPVMKIINNKKAFKNYRLGIIRPDLDHTTWILVNGSPVLDNKNELDFAIINFIDQTSSLKASKELEEKTEEYFELNKQLRDRETKLIESEQRMRNIIDHSSNMFYSHTVDHELTFISPQVEQILGCKAEEAYIKWTSFLSDNPENEKGLALTIEAINTGKAQPPYELELIRTDGEKIWVEVREAPLIEDGKVTAIVGSLNEITKRKKALQELKAREEFLDKIIDSSALSTWISDAKGYAIRVNPACLEFFVAKEEEVVNKYCIFKDSVIADTGLMPEIKKVYENGEVVSIIIDYSLSDVDHVNVESSPKKVVKSILTPVIGDKGEVVNVIIQSIDLTEIKQTEYELIKAKEKAEESDKLKSAFLANMSHEIRTPMNGIMGFTQLLKDSNLEAGLMKKYLNIIQKSGERMLSTIDDIIEISKIETGQVRINKTKVSFNEIIKDYFDFFIREANEKSIELEYHLSLPDNLAIVVTDRQMFNSIFTNLLKNAIKYTKKGSISFGYSVHENEIEFYVKDSGIGISEDEQEIIFERFRQSSVPKSEVYEGSGLGLAISKAYLDLLGGKIWVESKKEVGSTFYFSLPFSRVQIDQSKPDSKGDKKTASKLGDKCILIVEDDVFGMMLLREILDPLVKKLYEAPSGNIALDFVNNNPIDIILMDIKIPDIDGISLTKKIRETNRDVIIIAQTAYAMAGDKDEAITAGCDGYITKPINPTELVNMLNSAIQ